MAARGLWTAALVESAIITWRDFGQQKSPPPPSDYVAVVIIYGGLTLLPASAGDLPSLIGWGLVIATFLNLWSPQKPLTLSVLGGTTNVPSAQQQAAGAKITTTAATPATT
jgi:hypothetical protein